MAEVVQLQVAHDDREALQRLVRTLVEERLIACGQVVGPIASTYRWEGEVQEAQEWLALLKTTRDRAEQVIAAVAHEHPYDTPEVLALPVLGGLAGYLGWVAEVTREEPAPG